MLNLNLKSVFKVVINGEVEFETDNFTELLMYEIYPNTSIIPTNDLYKIITNYCNEFGAEIKVYTIEV